jgi:hypothetical protein
MGDPFPACAPKCSGHTLQISIQRVMDARLTQRGAAAKRGVAGGIARAVSTPYLRLRPVTARRAGPLPVRGGEGELSSVGWRIRDNSCKRFCSAIDQNQRAPRGFFRSADSLVRVFLPHRCLRADPAMRDCPRSFVCGSAALGLLCLFAANCFRLVGSLAPPFALFVLFCGNKESVVSVCAGLPPSLHFRLHPPSRATARRV